MLHTALTHFPDASLSLRDPALITSPFHSLYRDGPPSRSTRKWQCPRTKRSVRPRLIHPEARHFVEGGLVVIFGLVAYIIAIGVITGDS